MSLRVGSSWLSVWCLLTILLSSSVAAQSENPAVSITFATLTKTIDSRSAAIGDEFILRMLSDIVVDGSVVIPKDSRVRGHVAGAIGKSKTEPESLITIAIDHAVLPNGIEVPLKAIVAAIAAPSETLTSDPTYSMMHSNEPKMV